jgi:hypothetical protein
MLAFLESFVAGAAQHFHSASKDARERAYGVVRC